MLCACVALTPLAHAQTIGDYSRSHRALLEAEMAKNTAKALGSGPNINTSATPLPAALATAPMAPASPLPTMPMAGMPTESGSDISVVGVIVLSKRAMVELNLNGETFLLLAGDKVPGTAWEVSSVYSDSVVLKSGPKRRSFAVNTGGR